MLLRKGSRGDDVKEVQKLLNDKGYGQIGVDGIFGSGTAKAVKRFQAASGLGVDGIVGPNTPDCGSTRSTGSQLILGRIVCSIQKSTVVQQAQPSWFLASTVHTSGTCTVENTKRYVKEPRRYEYGAMGIAIIYLTLVIRMTLVLKAGTG